MFLQCWYLSKGRGGKKRHLESHVWFFQMKPEQRFRQPGRGEVRHRVVAGDTERKMCPSEELQIVVWMGGGTLGE